MAVATVTTGRKSDKLQVQEAQRLAAAWGLLYVPREGRGYDIDHAIRLCKIYRDAGVDVFHVTTGGEGPAGQRKPGNYPGFQVPFARQIKEAVGVPVVAVGMLEDPVLADAVVRNGDADLAAIARGLLRDPHWALNAAVALKQQTTVPKQYQPAYL